jgi:hypothetical protein
MDCVKSIPRLAVAATLLCATPAFAHISLEQGGTHLSRYGDGYLKDGPCGKAGGTRGTHVYTYAPGATITVSFVETISHPSYFRFAFQQSGDDEFKEPASIKPIDPARPCPIDTGDHCNKTSGDDFYNTNNVLPGMDDLDPHLAGASKPWTYQVTLPNVECDNCTLQVIQVMEDNLAHGDYDPTPGSGIPDIYHQCIDLVLKAGAPNDSDGGTGGSGGGGGGGSGGSGGAGGGGSGGAGGGGGSGASASRGGCSMSGAAPIAGASLLFAALALLALRRRTR